jgi:hypothetical protein
MKQNTHLFMVVLILVTLAAGYEPLIAQDLLDPEYEEGCTIGVASGSATSDGRPMIWKTRDVDMGISSRAYYDSSGEYKYVSTVSGGSTPEFKTEVRHFGRSRIV